MTNRNIRLLQHIIFGIFAFFVFTLLDYLIPISWSMPSFQFSICTILISTFRVAIFTGLLLLYVKKVIIAPGGNFKIEKPKISLTWVLFSFLIPISVSLAFFVFTKGKIIINYDFNQNIKYIVFGFFKVGLCSAIVEEFFFRGFLFKLLEDRFNKKVAILVTSLFFASLHLFGVKSLFDVVSIMVVGTIVGVMFSIIAFQSGSIWNAIIVHGMWNFITSKIINISFSESPKAIINYVLNTNNKLIFNENIGIETSLFTLLCYLVVILLALRYSYVKNSEGRVYGDGRYW